MPKRKDTDLPALKVTKKGDFFVHHGGKKVYMGRDVKTAKVRLLEFCQNLHQTQKKFVLAEKNHCSVSELVLMYLKTVSKNHSHYYHIRIAAKTCHDMYGELDVNAFGPVALKKVRSVFYEKGNSRRQINELVCWIRAMFRFGVENEMVEEGTLARLERVKNLMPGEARDNPPREDVPDEVVERTLPFLSRTVRDMVVLQRLTGMRPSELFRMTMEQIDTSRADVWVYRPGKHKGTHIGKGRVIALGRPEIEIVRGRADGKKDDEPVFAPADALAERWGTGKLQKKLSMVGMQYNRSSYRQAILRAIQRANREGMDVPHWTPYQLRHTNATATSYLFGEDAAAVQLGHTSTQTTRRYDHSAEAKAVDLVRRRDEKRRKNDERFNQQSK